MRNRILSTLTAASLVGLLSAAYLSSVGSVRAASDDPCAPGPDGVVPEMCQSVITLPEMSGGAFFSATFTQLVTGNEISRALFNVEGGSIEFSNDNLIATVGCNNIVGAAELTLGDPHTLTLAGPLASTKMFCEGLMDAEAALISILEGEGLSLVGDGITSSAGMIRIDGGVKIAMPDAVWPGSLPFLLQVDGTNYDVANGFVTIEAGQLSASVGCNTLVASVTVEAKRVMLQGELISTLMYCDGLMDAESALVTVLSGANLHWVNTFELRSDAGAALFPAYDAHCGDCVTAAAPSDPDGLALVLMLLFAPIAAASVALSRGLTAVK